MQVLLLSVHDLGEDANVTMDIWRQYVLDAVCGRVYTCRRLIDLSNDDCRYSAPLPSNLGDVAMKCVI